MSSTQTQQARQFLAAVEAACADLDPAERSRLVGGLEEHLSELSADGVDLTAELGDPAAYTRELRSAAGLATWPALAVPGASAAAATTPATGPATQVLPLGAPTAALPLPVTQRPAHTNKVLLVVGLALGVGAVLVVGAAVLGGLFFVSSSSGVAVPIVPVEPQATVPITVPDVIGLQEGQARQELAAAGLRFTIETVSTGATPGQVLNQDPAAGVTVDAEAVVRIRVSTPS